MSYRERDRRDRSDGRSRDRHDSRRSDASSSRRSRSPSPPLLHKDVPRSFGRVPETTKDDDSNVLQRMTKKFNNAPLGSLTKCLEGNRKIKVWTRNFKEVRGICTGYVIAFDKHWNLVMSDVDEVYLKPRKTKTPFLENLTAAADFTELPRKVPKQKKDPKDTEKNPPPAPQSVESGTEKTASGTEKTASGAEKTASGAEKKKKKRRSKKKKRPSPQKRHIPKLFVRGDNIVMAAVMDESEGEEEEEEEEEELEEGEEN